MTDTYNCMICGQPGATLKSPRGNMVHSSCAMTSVDLAIQMSGTLTAAVKRLRSIVALLNRLPRTPGRNAAIIEVGRVALDINKFATGASSDTDGLAAEDHNAPQH